MEELLCRVLCICDVMLFCLFKTPTNSLLHEDKVQVRGFPTMTHQGAGSVKQSQCRALILRNSTLPPQEITSHPPGHLQVQKHLHIPLCWGIASISFLKLKCHHCLEFFCRPILLNWSLAPRLCISHSHAGGWNARTVTASLRGSCISPSIYSLASSVNKHQRDVQFIKCQEYSSLEATWHFDI